MSKVIAVQTGTYQIPVGSVITTGSADTTIFYRNIGEKHILRKKNYQAIFMDDKVVTYLSTSDRPTEVVYDFNGDTPGTYRTIFENYERARPVKMAGRLQRGVSLERFVFEPARTHYQRPKEMIII